MEQSNNTLSVDKIQKTSSRIIVEFSVDGGWSELFEDNVFWAEYSENVDNVPDAVAIVPFIGDVIVLASIIGATIKLNCIDACFYSSIFDFLAGFQKTYPDTVFHTGVI